jgi:hypothetical protein
MVVLMIFLGIWFPPIRTQMVSGSSAVFGVHQTSMFYRSCLSPKFLFLPPYPTSLTDNKKTRNYAGARHFIPVVVGQLMFVRAWHL